MQTHRLAWYKHKWKNKYCKTWKIFRVERSQCLFKQNKHQQYTKLRLQKHVWYTDHVYRPTLKNSHKGQIYEFGRLQWSCSIGALSNDGRTGWNDTINDSLLGWCISTVYPQGISKFYTALAHDTLAPTKNKYINPQ